MRNYVLMWILFFANHGRAAEAEPRALDQQQCQYHDLPDDIKVEIVISLIEHNPAQHKDLWGSIFVLLGKKTMLGNGDIKKLYGAIAKNPVAVNYDIYNLNYLLPSTPEILFLLRCTHFETQRRYIQNILIF